MFKGPKKKNIHASNIGFCFTFDAWFILDDIWFNVSVDYQLLFTKLRANLLFQVETVEGYKDLQIPSGTQPGETLKFTNMGVPNLRRPSVRGDHHFVVRVEIPKNIRFISLLTFGTSTMCFLVYRGYQI